MLLKEGQKVEVVKDNSDIGLEVGDVLTVDEINRGILEFEETPMVLCDYDVEPLFEPLESFEDLEAGDVVKVKDYIDVIEKPYKIKPVYQMKEYEGKVTKIELFEDGYDTVVLEDCSIWSWSADMLEKPVMAEEEEVTLEELINEFFEAIEEDDKEPTEFSEGDKVIYTTSYPETEYNAEVVYVGDEVGAMGEQVGIKTEFDDGDVGYTFVEPHKLTLKEEE